jgi:hypothetical protein
MGGACNRQNVSFILLFNIAYKNLRVVKVFPQIVYSQRRLLVIKQAFL